MDMGLGELGSQKIIHKRKFRWTFEVEFCKGKRIPPNFVKLAARPNISIEEQEINYLNGKTWIPGKGTWETITVTYYDIAGQPDGGGEGNIHLWSWLATVYDFRASPGLTHQASARADYSGICTLFLYDGCGNTLEQWTLEDAWPQAVQFGDLDYSSSEECVVELTIRYGKVNYYNLCGAQPEACCNNYC